MTEVMDDYQPVTGDILEELNSHVVYINQMFSEQCEFDFGYNLESIEALDSFINSTRELLDDDSKGDIARIVAPFLGEALISIHGGNWAYYPEGDIGVNLCGGKIMASPHSKVEKQLFNGEEDSISFFYKVILKKLSGE
ncbi:MAG: hypothetical protein JKX78_04605 [Alteromonadaceae bacterium]|nr:hypothetical protein [Alteromonadaceae bacterium]